MGPPHIAGRPCPSRGWSHTSQSLAFILFCHQGISVSPRLFHKLRGPTLNNIKIGKTHGRVTWPAGHASTIGRSPLSQNPNFYYYFILTGRHAKLWDPCKIHDFSYFHGFMENRGNKSQHGHMATASLPRQFFNIKIYLF